MPDFIPGLQLSEAYYREVVRPVLDAAFPELVYAAALIGTGSDVLGFDTARSTDHGWGPRVLLFVDEADIVPVADAIDPGLPETFRGWPVRYGWDAVPVQHHVTVTTLPEWLGGGPRGGRPPPARPAELLPRAPPPPAADWLVPPQQLLLGVFGGAVFRDDTGELARVREQLAWYPDPVWRWLLGCEWRRLAQEEP